MPNWKNLIIANLKLSILECLYNFDTTNKWYIEECIKKAIKKNGKTLSLSTLESIIKLWKHNSSLNRLYNLTKLTYPTLSEEIKKLIKKYGFVL
jgi:DNA-binding MarR family transcriptional regulator